MKYIDSRALTSVELKEQTYVWNMIILLYK